MNVWASVSWKFASAMDAANKLGPFILAVSREVQGKDRCEAEPGLIVLEPQHGGDGQKCPPHAGTYRSRCSQETARNWLAWLTID